MDCWDLTVNLKKECEQSLGIGFKRLPRPPHCQVSALVENGVASMSGQIEIGDLLLNINGINVQHLSPGEVGAVLARHSADSTIALEVRRSSANRISNNINSSEDVLPNGYPAINVVSSSPEQALREGGSSPEKNISPVPVGKRRTRRTNVISGGVGPLTEIPEAEDTLHLPNCSPEISHRHSFTPEASRKTVEDVKKVSMRSSKSLDLSNLPQWRAGSSAQSVTIHNLLDDTEMTDRLHTKRIKEFKETGCAESHCKGSHMQLKPKRPYGTVRSAEEILPLAEDFIKQYMESKKVALGNEYENKLAVRLWQVRQEIEEKGHYDLTYEELVYAARTAWRNAPRCVNRIVWRQLEVLDARDATSPKEMFEAIVHHIKYANNGGNLRSTITVFPKRTKPKSDFRVWNPQLIRYAGYKNEDGTILGDPSNVEFTEMCVDSLGWTPPKNKTPFDVLPLVLQANGGEPEFFELDKDIVLQCDISHPEYDWFLDFGLKWYALPAVSGMLLDCGGLEFPGIPFSGWYMVTEIARDLGDPNRYNYLKPIAKKMGLNTQTYKLWKDRAMIELNVAILHSFQKANFSIVDHHSTTESFITHMKSETQTRGGCPADWVWIVPPISGTITPVFHQEMLLYHLSPSYEYQYDPWKYHNWSTSDTTKHPRTRSFHGPHRFKKLANMVKIHYRMYRKVYNKRVKATVLFATETGRARNYAHVVKDVFGRVFASKVCCMEDYDKANLEHEQLLIIVTSTFGSGDPPANGEIFGRYLLDLRNGTVSPGAQTTPTPRSHRMSTIVAPNPAMLDANKKGMDRPLTQVKYAVFGLGSRAYPNFCTFAHTCDNLLRDLGAEMIFSCGEGDELCGQEESFQAWLQQCYHRACEVYSIDPEKTESDLEGYKSGYSRENFRVKSFSQPHKERDICAGLKTVHSKDIKSFVIKSRTKLQSPNSDRSTILVVLDTNDNKIHYEPGDHIAIYPQNSGKLVNELIQCFNSSVDPDEPIYIESRRSSQSEEHWVEEKRMPIPVTVREALTYYLDISNPPSPQFIKLLAKQATRSMDQEELNELAKGGDKYEDWKYERFPNLIDVLNQFHSLKIDVTLLLQQLPLLQCRYYSISSSPRMYPHEVHVTVAIVSFKKRNGTGPKHNGVCSTWLNRIEIGSNVPCIIRQAHAFHMPEDTRTPIIMVGPGTGIAPYRSFWQERLFLRNEALKSQLSAPSPVKPQVKPQTLNPSQKLGNRRRRKTEFEPPKLSLLQTPGPDGELPLSTASNSSNGFSTMRRSLSDTENNEEIEKMLASREKSWGCLTLYFGCRQPDLDYIYKDELMRAKVSGALSEVHVGFSREPGKPKTYVQHLLKDNAEKIVRQLMEERGHIYVCGDISMAADVCRTLQGIFEENAAMSSEEARCLIESMKDRGFYHEDIFGVTLKHQEVTTRVRTAAKKAWRILVTATETGYNLPSPMTPSIRMPSPAPGRSFMTLDPSNYSSSTLPLSRSQRSHPKRPTVTVLIPTNTTPTDSKPKSIGEPKKTRAQRGSLQNSPSIDDSVMFSSSGMKLITIEEPQKNILEPLNEVSESPLETSPRTTEPEVPTIGVHSPHDIALVYPLQASKADTLPTVTVETPPKDVPPEVRVDPPPADSPPTAKDDVSTLTTEKDDVSTDKDEVNPSVTRRKNMTAEKKKARRIRTNSKVETVL